MGRLLGYLLVMGAGGAVALAIVGALAEQHPSATPLADIGTGTPQLLVWAVLGCTLVAFNAVARFLLSDLPAAGKWVRGQRRLAMHVGLCVIFGGYLLLG